MNIRNFFSELRRRNIYRVAVAYAVVAWLIIQIAASTFPVLEIPRWCVRLVVVLLALGFPVAVILAWAYELNPEGIRRTEEVALEKSIRKGTGQKLNGLIIGVLACAVVFLLYQRFRPGEAATNASEKSIAVL